MGVLRVFGLLSLLSLSAFAEFSPAPAVAKKTIATPNSSKRMAGRAYANDTVIYDLSNYQSTDVHFGILLDGQPVTDEAYEARVMEQAIRAASGLSSEGFSVGTEGLLYDNKSFRILFFWYETDVNGDVRRSGAFEPNNQIYLERCFQRNVEESIRRKGWTPPSYAKLGVPQSKNTGVNLPLPRSVSAKDFVSGLTKLSESIDEVRKVDRDLADRLDGLIAKSRVVAQSRLNLEGGSAPTVIYQMIQYTPNGILVALDSYEKLPPEYQADGMLYALLTGILPARATNQSKAWKFHLQLLAMIRSGGIEVAPYEEAKRAFAMSPETEALFRIVEDFDTYRSSVMERYAVGPSNASVVSAELKNLHQYLEIEAYGAMVTDYQKVFGGAPLRLPESPENSAVARFKYSAWNILAQSLADSAGNEEQLEAKLDALRSVLRLASDGRITAADLDRLVAEKQAPRSK